MAKKAAAAASKKSQKATPAKPKAAPAKAAASPKTPAGKGTKRKRDEAEAPAAEEAPAAAPAADETKEPAAKKGRGKAKAKVEEAPAAAAPAEAAPAAKATPAKKGKGKAAAKEEPAAAPAAPASAKKGKGGKKAESAAAATGPFPGTFDHAGFAAVNFDKACQFYSAALAPIGFKQLATFPGHAGFGVERPIFWLGSDRPGYYSKSQKVGNGPVHFAFNAGTRAQVDAFFEAAVAAGAKDYGKPGVRTEYTPTYYAAFVVDPEGHNIEVVCHAAE